MSRLVCPSCTCHPTNGFKCSTCWPKSNMARNTEDFYAHRAEVLKRIQQALAQQKEPSK